MKVGQKMWANNDREAKNIINAAQACGFNLLGEGEREYIPAGGFYFHNYGVTRSNRDNREYFEEHSFDEFHFATPVELPESLTTQQVIERYCTKDVSDNPVVSDGLSTSYYQLTITNKAGESIDCEMGDVIRCTVGDNFSLGNVLKAARRMYEASQGRGKKDVSMDYDANKIAYFSREFADFYGEPK